MKISQVSGFGDKIWGQQRPDVLDIPGKSTCGGGEAALLRTSFELARRGHAVTVYYPGEAATYRGVTFQPVSAAYASLKQGNADVVVAWSDGIACRFAPPGALRVFSQQLNDMPADDEFWRSVDLVISPSKSHLDYLFDRFVPEAYAATRRAVVPNGIDDRYSNRLPWAERQRWAAYWSSPDRGLHHLLRIWPDVIEAVPDAQLHVFYRLRDYVLGGRDFFAHPDFCWRARVIDRQLRDLPASVVLHDAVSRTALAYWQNRARVYAYPLDPVTYTEGFCLAIGEALAAGCHVVARPVDAVEEVYGDAVEWIRADFVDADFLRRFTDAVVAGLLAEERPQEERHFDPAHYGWDVAVDRFLEVVKR